MVQLKNIGSVYCGNGIWDVLNAHLREAKHSKIFVLTDTNTHQHCLPKLLSELDLDSEPLVLQMPAGEHHKRIDSCMKLWEQLSEMHADRNSLLINLGGGVVTDLGGFVASTFKRGIDFINIPTSLLAMVDASVGGKTGVDLGSLKNQIGVIRLPAMVLLHTEFLQTLPEAHFRSGKAEMLKHGIIVSEAYFDQVVPMTLTSANCEQLIWESVLIKERIVSEDPTEKGLRKLLNYGHTLGHAIESYFLRKDSKTALLHGDAIAIGMILATWISSEMLGFPKSSLDKISREIIQIFQKQTFSNEDIDAIRKLLIYDKKNSDGRIYFVLLEDFAKHKINCEVSDSLISGAFAYYASLD
jgi:3-dehydroquinate synthase